MAQLKVDTQYGTVEGISREGVRIWKGLPYARPPIGELRFQAPAAPEPWEGIRKADTYGPISIQPVNETAGLFGQDAGAAPSEDCLYLNVWAPEEAESQPLPVMVWIHGGAFVTGSGSVPMYDGTRFARQGKVIMVSLNYRLGVLGFLHAGYLGEGFTSNAGLLDQIAALQWVQDNIAGFGGDPQQVTVFGESAGSMSIAALLAMPQAKGLFRRAIMQSGASQIMPEPAARSITAALLGLLGISPQEPGKLKAVPPEQLMAAAGELRKRYGNDIAMLQQPVIDAATLPHEPLAAIREGFAKDIALIIGTNRDEGGLFIRPDTPVMEEKDWLQAMELMTGIRGETAAAVAARYPRTAAGQAQILTDLYFWRSALQFAAAQSRHAPVWMYRFDWTSEAHPFLMQAIHAGEIMFVFDHLELLANIGVEADAEARALAHRMQEAWVSFAKHGAPAVEGTVWPPYELPERATYIFNTQAEVVNDPDAEKRMLLGE
ncbi:para-nitrobenzyl esterase [Paenibacillus yonginensis]|uniref:Carboxylic ester hydrolase n=1 Tax=Paenibacillus yonginensis TaxID=1462996 RepID=A0A1B1MWF8_9BACL|nr:carboxylesterase/lipase family protein [Paenibacillus yonginensis]ANS73520.1 para-nitrobenzyl esterase [Paenibacillus yonginensis]